MALCAEKVELRLDVGDASRLAIKLDFLHWFIQFRSFWKPHLFIFSAWSIDFFGSHIRLAFKPFNQGFTQLFNVSTSIGIAAAADTRRAETLHITIVPSQVLAAPCGSRQVSTNMASRTGRGMCVYHAAHRGSPPTQAARHSYSAAYQQGPAAVGVIPWGVGCEGRTTVP